MTKARDLATSGPSTGLVHINTTAFSGASSHSFGSDASPIFTSDYPHYKIILNELNTTTTNRTIFLRVRANTTDFTSSNYNYEYHVADGASQSQGRVLNTSSFEIASASYATDVSSAIIELQNPQKTLWTTYASNVIWTNTGNGPSMKHFTGFLYTSSSYNGFTIYASGDFSGIMSIYGYRN